MGTAGGSVKWRKVARSLVAAYLSASWCMNYAYTTIQLEAMWLEASNAEDPSVAFLNLNTLLDAANNYFGIDDSQCPVSAGGF